MGYLNENGLARYDGLIKNWVTFKSGTVDGIDPLLNWQKTETAASVTCYPLPAAPLEPVVNFLFTETPPVGEKSPTNPSTITGVSSVELARCGKNLAPERTDVYTHFGVTFTPQSDGGFHITGSANGINNVHYELGDFLYKSSCTYTVSLISTTSTGSVILYCYDTDVAFNPSAGNSSTSTNNNADRLLTVRITATKTATNLDLVVYPQIELGSNATTFEPYSGNSYTLSLGGTFYGGSVDLSTGVMTVTHVMVEPDSLAFDVSAHPADAANFQYADTFGRTVTTDGNTLTITGETGGQIVYNLATPETVSLTPTQIYSLSQLDPYTPRINTVYSDQVSVQVGYPKSPQATASELTNAIISLGGNV